MSKTESVAAADILTDELKRGPQDMPSRERAQEMLDIDMQYAAHFHNRDFKGMETCLVGSPDFEMQFFPVIMSLNCVQNLLMIDKRMAFLCDALNPPSTASPSPRSSSSEACK